MMGRIERGPYHPATARDRRLFRHGPDVGGVVKSILDYLVFQLHRSSPSSLSTGNDAFAKDSKPTSIFPGARFLEIGRLRGHQKDPRGPAKLLAECFCETVKFGNI